LKAKTEELKKGKGAGFSHKKAACLEKEQIVGSQTFCSLLGCPLRLEAARAAISSAILGIPATGCLRLEQSDNVTHEVSIVARDFKPVTVVVLGGLGFLLRFFHQRG